MSSALLQSLSRIITGNRVRFALGTFHFLSAKIGAACCYRTRLTVTRTVNGMPRPYTWDIAPLGDVRNFCFTLVPMLYDVAHRFVAYALGRLDRRKERG